MRKLLLGSVALGLMLAAGVAQAQEKKTIAVSIPAADHGWTGGVVYHAEQEAKALEARYPGLKVIVKTSPDGASQANALEDLTTQGIDALVTLPHNSDELTDPIRQVKSKGVFITVVDRALTDNTVADLYVAGNNPALGRVAGAYIKEKLNGKGNVVVIRGLPIVIDEERNKGFDEGIAGSDIKVLDRQFGNWSRDDAFKIMQDYLSKYPQIDAVWTQDDDMAVGVLEAINQAKRTDIQFVIAGAGMKDMIKKVMDGDKMIPVDILYPPAMVAVAMDLTAAGLYDKLPVRGSYILDATLVTKENASQFYYPDSPF
ncbi:substrate-binding domain-containing protein [Kaistia dalseonensis]|uniref:Ribose transport system substrate-binding protein n=1 Tax=Kaistia dalseonensis TaxID=410840 RepID=A0ABU0H030_9HYPH|nr:substrate-binding domain-containing protein [Kaistia dalseonensis]MCX5493113.1 substrate-binding domain-containing protein [Kaistia dalseonensis]MDQ0435668.1 ribose transport system substrate-binding protein [Kaistia dalseonensis]